MPMNAFFNTEVFLPIQPKDCQPKVFSLGLLSFEFL